MTGDKYEILLLIAQAARSGLPLPEAIRLTIGDRSGGIGRNFLKLADDLDEGVEPKEAVRRSGLPASIADLLAIALNSEDFAETFEELAELEAARLLTVQKISQALIYPLILLLFGIATIWSLLFFTVPQFELIYLDFDTELPVMTTFLIRLSRWATDTLWLGGMFLLLVALFWIVYLFFPRFWFCVPIFGHALRCMYSARILRHLGCLIQQNIPLPEALEQCGRAMRNSAYRQDCLAAAADARVGRSLPEIVVRYYWLFPSWLAPILATDGSSESPARSLCRAAETVDRQKDGSLLFFQTLSLPLFLLFVVDIVGFFVIALYLPLIKLITELSG